MYLDELWWQGTSEHQQQRGKESDALWHFPGRSAGSECEGGEVQVPWEWRWAHSVDIECLCTLVVLCGTFAVITSAVSFPG